MKNILLATFVMVFCLNASAESPAGYDEFCGLPVFIKQTPQDAVATIYNGQRIIIIDPSVASNWGLSRVFALAHECAHHVLGHLSPTEMFRRQHMNATRQQELSADCWAAEVLANNGYHDDIRRTIIQNLSSGPMMQGPYPSGTDRASYIAQCAGIQLPTRNHGFPSGYGMLQCGCWTGNAPVVASEQKCQSSRVQIAACPGYCPGGGQPYGYVCQ